MPQDMPLNSAPQHSELFELTTFLEGRTRAWGIFEDRFGRLRRRLSVEMFGHWKNGVFLLDERFVYDSGAEELRTWHITPVGPGRFRATCPDCIGDATGESSADSIRMSYVFRLKLEKREVAVTLDDRIHRMGDAIAINRATMSKWGIKLGELSLFFEKLPAASIGGTGRQAA